jgi:hypothetical protein
MHSTLSVTRFLRISATLRGTLIGSAPVVGTGLRDHYRFGGQNTGKPRFTGKISRPEPSSTESAVIRYMTRRSEAEPR